MRLITWHSNWFVVAIHIHLRKETRDWLNHIRGNYYLRVKGITPFPLFTQATWCQSYINQTVLHFLQYFYYHRLYCPLFATQNHLKFTKHIMLFTAIYFISHRIRSMQKTGSEPTIDLGSLHISPRKKHQTIVKIIDGILSNCRLW